MECYNSIVCVCCIKAGVSKMSVSTPHIDAALHTFRRRSAVPASETSTLSTSEPESSVLRSPAHRVAAVSCALF
jgi:hypothetical protein